MASLDTNPWYVDLTRHTRQNIAHQVKSITNRGVRNYSNLKNPNNKSTGNSDLYRFSVMFRPSTLPSNGKRSINIGGSEILLVLQGVSLIDNTNWKNGVKFDYKKAPYRIVMGENIRSEEFADSFFDEFARYFPSAKRVLALGAYDNFVKKTLEIADDNIGIFKDLINEEDYMREKTSILTSKIMQLGF